MFRRLKKNGNVAQAGASEEEEEEDEKTAEIFKLTRTGGIAGAVDKSFGLKGQPDQF
jgi:hypothetical protein